VISKAEITIFAKRDVIEQRIPRSWVPWRSRGVNTRSSGLGGITREMVVRSNEGGGIHVMSVVLRNRQKRGTPVSDGRLWAIGK